MGGRLHLFVLIAAVLSLLTNAIAWAGLGQDPGVGAIVRESARRESPLVVSYLLLGDGLRAVPGVAGVSTELALAGYGPALDRLHAEPAAAMDVLALGGFGPVNAILRINTWATPVLLVLWGILYWLRPRNVHLARRKR
ncbi:MAG TPA: hypothetical protein PLI00_02495 [Pseudomonadota bacterium]|nr:hypothetical protein [Xanthomonadales bacterium]HQW63905.1 hypothetical protein [Pseudomonadota bacterium]MBP6692028.1 hypothetical protein [Xanthomonadales bacterium]MBP7418068.1 hypothetical protein [Xanthomonadales bacterium]HQX24598.1 hypothetical protein [Pseudomonadota bacterium]